MLPGRTLTLTVPVHLEFEWGTLCQEHFTIHPILPKLVRQVAESCCKKATTWSRCCPFYKGNCMKWRKADGTQPATTVFGREIGCVNLKIVLLQAVIS